MLFCCATIAVASRRCVWRHPVRCHPEPYEAMSVCVVIHIMFIHVISSCLFLTLTLDVSLTFTSPVMIVSQHRVMRLKVFSGSGYIVLSGIVCCLLNVVGNCSNFNYVNYLYALCSSVYSFTCLNKSWVQHRLVLSGGQYSETTAIITSSQHQRAVTSRPEVSSSVPGR